MNKENTTPADRDRAAVVQAMERINQEAIVSILQSLRPSSDPTAWSVPDQVYDTALSEAILAVRNRVLPRASGVPEAERRPDAYQQLKDGKWVECSEFVARGWGDKLDEGTRALYASPPSVAAPEAEALPRWRCDRCDNGIDIAWEFCAWCGSSENWKTVDPTQKKPDINARALAIALEAYADYWEDNFDPSEAMATAIHAYKGATAPPPVVAPSGEELRKAGYAYRDRMREAIKEKQELDVAWREIVSTLLTAYQDMRLAQGMSLAEFNDLPIPRAVNAALAIAPPSPIASEPKDKDQ